MVMARSRDWKYIHHEGVPPQLFDLRDDPHELMDLGQDPGLTGIRSEHRDLVFDWLRTRHIHPTVSEPEMDATICNEARSGTSIGVW